MADTKKGKNIGDETDVPAQLDVVPSVPGTYVGGHDVQGADGTERTDRPGEILGTAIPDESRKAAREHSQARSDYVTSEVDRANREELPLLGGTVDDGWEPGNAGTTDAAPAARSEAASTRTTDAAGGNSGIAVKSGIDRG